MQLTLWTYEGPPHIGAMRIATSMEGVHYVLHAPQGDTYADLLFTMIERRDKRPPVTYTTFQARDLGGDTAGLLTDAVKAAYERFKPRAMLVGESCTAELIQDQPGSLALGMGLPVPVVPLELPSYSKKENWGASETLYYLVRTLVKDQVGKQKVARSGARPLANVLGPSSMGFRIRDNIKEVTSLLREAGVDVNVVAPEGASPEDIMRIPDADFNICLYPEVAQTTCAWLERTFGQPYVKTVPIGVGATRDFLLEIAGITGLEISESLLGRDRSRLPWYSRSVDSNYLTGKRVFIFGDATHVLAAARVAKEEFAFEVVGLGTYSREFARPVRQAAEALGIEALITDDYLEVEARISAAEPELVLGTQMERHIAKRLGVPCAVISAPFHVQDVPARYSPQMGYEGANVIFDTWVHPLMMGLEEHLLGMFRDDFEFNDESAPSHLGGGQEARPDPVAKTADTTTSDPTF
jgi:light-independent protochlorophyllide reductase subunit B